MDFAAIPVDQIPYMTEALRRAMGGRTSADYNQVIGGYDNQNHGMVFVKNNTGDPLNPKQAITLGDPVDEDDEMLRGNLVYEIGTFDPGKPVAVVQSYIADGDTGPAVIAGTALVTMTVEDEDDKHALADTTDAFVSKGTDDLNSGDLVYLITWKESGTGPDKKATILLPAQSKGGGVNVIGPCTPYTPDEELTDTDFETEYPGGCIGPNRLGVNLLNTSSGVTTIVPLEFETDTPNLKLSSEVFNLACKSFSIDVYIEMEFLTLDKSNWDDAGDTPVDGVVFLLRKDSDDSIFASYRNAISSYLSESPGSIQLGPGPGCGCGTLPYDLCLSLPSR